MTDVFTYDPRCSVCGELKSVHTPTHRDPFTCPRVARGEGAYVSTGTWSSGLNCRTCGGVCDGHDTYRFVPISEMTDIERKTWGFEKP